MDFIASNSNTLQLGEDHKGQYSCDPIGFDIVFPWMLSLAKDHLNFNVPMDSTLLHSMLQHRELEIQRWTKNFLIIEVPHTDTHTHSTLTFEHCRKGRGLWYVAEGLGESCNWKEVIMVQQRSNGSLFNSPATTAAALINYHDDRCFDYLQSLMKIHSYGGKL